jgi:hypothetical protein
MIPTPMPHALKCRHLGGAGCDHISFATLPSALIVQDSG